MELKEKFGKIKDALKKANPFKSKQSDEVDVMTEQQRREHEQIEPSQEEGQIEEVPNEERTNEELEIGEERRRQGGEDETLEFYDDQ